MSKVNFVNNFRRDMNFPDPKITHTTGIVKREDHVLSREEMKIVNENDFSFNPDSNVLAVKFTIVDAKGAPLRKSTAADSVVRDYHGSLILENKRTGRAEYINLGNADFYRNNFINGWFDEQNTFEQGNKFHDAGKYKAALDDYFERNSGFDFSYLINNSNLLKNYRKMVSSLVDAPKKFVFF